MLNMTRHVIWHSHFRPLIVARSSTSLIRTTDQGMDGLDRAAGLCGPFKTGNNC